VELKTSCLNCIFAEINSVDNLTIQTGCSLKRLEKFVKQGKANLVKNESEINKDLKQYYEIGRYCNTCRNSDWLNWVNQKKIHPEDKILEEIYPSLSIVFILESEKDFDNLYLTCKNLKNQDYISNEFIVLNNSGANQLKVSNILDEYLGKEDIIWKHIKPINIYEDSLFILLDNLNKIESKFILVLKDDQILNVPRNLTFKIHYSINTLLNRWILIKNNEDFPFLTTKGMLHNTVYSEFIFNEGLSENEKQSLFQINEELNIIKKIEKMAKLNNEENFIQNFDYLCKQ